MDAFLVKFIRICFYLLFLLVPLAFFPQSSELFEFNKMIITYFFTILITCAWFIRCIINKKLLIDKSKLNIPILIFLITELLSTLLSIDSRTSLLGYYSRFHGGLLSSISYALLYWIFVSTMNKPSTKKALFILFISALIISIYGIFEHFGHSFSCLLVTQNFTVDCWVQDVKNRVFATIGQPNWLAAWLIALIPVALAFTVLSFKNKSKYFLTYFFWTILSGLLFLTLLYTKSRSGLLGLSASFILFAGGAIFLIIHKQLSLKSLLLPLILPILIILASIIYEGTPFTPGIVTALSNKSSSLPETVSTAPALEVERFDTGKIRMIVWKGALDIWKAYPLFGSGVETFAYSYYRYRPVEHNSVSEWDFLYNKAHNEYLNFLATTGTVGFLAYLFLIASIAIVLIKNGLKTYNLNSINNSHKEESVEINIEKLNINLINLGLVSGFVSILITNFFGFSVVPVALLFFLYPAIGESLNKNKEDQIVKNAPLYGNQRVGMLFVIAIMSYCLFLICRYWYADYLYGTGKANHDVGNLIQGQRLLSKAVEVTPDEPFYWNELAQSSADIAVALYNKDLKDEGNQFLQTAIAQSQKAVFLSPANVNFKRDQASIFFKLSIYNSAYLNSAKSSLSQAIEQAPTEAKLFYNYGLANLRTNEIDKGTNVLIKTIEMKPDYRDARYALSLVYIEKGEKEKAKKQLEYILTNLRPNDQIVKEELENLNKI
jgi:O-antigen ligase